MINSILVFLSVNRTLKISHASINENFDEMITFLTKIFLYIVFSFLLYIIEKYHALHLLYFTLFEYENLSGIPTPNVIFFSLSKTIQCSVFQLFRTFSILSFYFKLLHIKYFTVNLLMMNAISILHFLIK